jgi:hypothetical protein
MQLRVRDRAISALPAADVAAQGCSNGRSARLIVMKTLLGCGAASAALYIAMDTVAALRYDGYSYRSQTISELSAVGSPTRAFWLVASVPYALLVIGFALGVIAAARGRGSLRAIGAMIGAIGVLALVAWPFAPMHQRAVLAVGEGTASDTMHLVLSGADGILMLAIIGIGAATSRGRFRLYSLLTMATVLAMAPYNAIGGARLSNGEPTPWLGIVERVMVFAPMIWLAVLGVRLWQAEDGASRNGGPVASDTP